MDELGVRELRAQLAQHLRRAHDGERLIITLDGTPIAQLGPIVAADAEVTLADLSAQGLVIPLVAPIDLRPSFDCRCGPALDSTTSSERFGVDSHDSVLDSTALLARFLEGAASDLTRSIMAADSDWCASSVALTECFMLIDRLGDDPDRADELRRNLRDDWERMYVIPVDQLCLDTAAELGRRQPIKFVDALHIAAASRLPKPLTYLTFDPNQLPVALAEGFEVESTLG